MKLDPEELREVVEEIGQVIQGAGEYVDAGKELIDIGKPVLVDVLKTLIGTYNDVREELEPELAAHSVLATQSVYRDYGNYQKAGFTAEQAFALVLAEIKPVNIGEALTNASRSFPRKDGDS